MQRKPIAYKYRKGTMKSTLHSTYAFFSLWESQAYKLRREWKREWNRLTGLLHTEYYFDNFILRSTIGQSIFVSILLTVAGCCVFLLRCMSCYPLKVSLHFLRCNYPTRLETRTKEFNWIASRRVFSKLSRRNESNSCQIFPSGIIAAQADYVYL